VEYVEVRCVDLNPYEPLGITNEQIHLLDAFLLYCLLSDSPQTPDAEYLEGQENQKRIVYSGRDPELKLKRHQKEIPMQDWAKEILESSMACAALLDQANGGEAYQNAVRKQYAKLDNPALTPAAQLLTDMQREGKSFFEQTLALAEQHRAYFSQHPLTAEQYARANQEAEASLTAQHELEDSKQVPFDEYLANYYDQYRSCQCS
jgi:glutamate--cysteine ligase